jgi:predicted porin
MQKKFIALAVVAAVSAPAFADVTAYGVLDAAIAHISADGQKADTQVVAGGLSTSRFGVKTVEDLNNGWKAVGVLEYALDNETNSTVGGTTSSIAAGKLAARTQMLAVAGDFGTVATGYLQTTGYDFAVKFDPTTGSSVSPLQSMTKLTNVIGSVTAGARAPRALAYISPDLGGVTVALNYTTDLSGGLGNLTLADSAAEAKVTATLLSATYNGGPLSVGFVYAKTSNPSAASAKDFKEYALGGSYDLGVVKLMGTYQSNKADATSVADAINPALGAAPTFTPNPAHLATLNLTTFQAKVYSLSAVAPVGPGAVVFTYAKNKTTAAGGIDVGGNGYTVAWLQPLSKQTTAYAAIEKISNSGNAGLSLFSVDSNAVSGYGSSMTANGSSTLLAVGLKKTF